MIAERSRVILFEDAAWEDYLWWQVEDRQILKRINALIRDIQRDPFNGIGKPEGLRGDLSGFWSRRITGEHRLVYKMDAGDLILVQLRGHY